MGGISNCKWNVISAETTKLWLHVKLLFFPTNKTPQGLLCWSVLFRAESFKWENIIVVGIVPSLDSEPKHQFLEPAVDELKAL